VSGVQPRDADHVLTAGTRYFFLSMSEMSDFSTFSQMTYNDIETRAE